MLLILLKYLFYFCILAVVVYIIKTIFTNNNPTPTPKPPKKLNGGDDYWADLEERAEQRVKKFDDKDFV